MYLIATKCVKQNLQYYKEKLTKLPYIHTSLKLVDEGYTDQSGWEQRSLHVGWRDIFKEKCSKTTIMIFA